jgi:hypothetical protein
MLIKTLGKKNGKTTFILKAKPRILRPWGAQDGWWHNQGFTYGYSSARTNRYQAGRDAELARIKNKPAYPTADMKQFALTTWGLKYHIGSYVRKIDGHGKSYGRRILVTADNHETLGRCRLVKPEPESETSYYTRMRNKLHRLEKQQ